MDDQRKQEGADARGNRFAQGMGRFFVVSGAISMACGAIGLVAVLVTGGSAEGLTIALLFIGTGFAHSMIGYAMRMLSF